MPSTRKLAIYPGLEKPWILGENLIAPLYKISVTPNYNLKHILIPTDKDGSCRSSKKLLSTAYGDHHRKPGHKCRGKRIIYSTTAVSKAQGHHERAGRKIVKARGPVSLL